jgi:membrane protein YdbS with pleckstrin-like domain
MSARTIMLGLLRVPHAPTPPAGDENVRIFRAAPNYFNYRVVQWFFTNLGGLIGLICAVYFARGLHVLIPESIPINGDLFEFFGVSPFSITEGLILKLITFIEICAIFGFIAQAIGGLLLLRLDFEQRWYLVSDRSLRTREGLLRMHEKTMTFANVQNVSIKQGPIQRLLGIANLQIRTAGGGSGGEEGVESSKDMHIAYLRGISDAVAVREVIRERLQQHRDAGLGDPDDSHDVAPLVVAARNLAAEARSLRLRLATP